MNVMGIEVQCAIRWLDSRWERSNYKKMDKLCCMQRYVWVCWENISGKSSSVSALLKMYRKKKNTLYRTRHNIHLNRNGVQFTEIYPNSTKLCMKMLKIIDGFGQAFGNKNIYPFGLRDVDRFEDLLNRGIKCFCNTSRSLIFLVFLWAISERTQNTKTGQKKKHWMNCC